MAVHDVVHRLLGLQSVPDAAQWKKFWSTRLAMLSAGCYAAASWWDKAPAEWHAQVPGWIGTVLMYAGMGAALLVPFAVVTCQPSLTKGDTDENEVR